MFYFKLAISNLKKNRSIYGPFILSMSFLVILNVIMQVLLKNKGMQTLPSAQAALTMFNFGSIIIMIFTIIFSIYTNSFLLKQRKKELGLYNILGLGKRELTRVMGWETLISYLITMGIGLLVGTIFARLCFLIFKRMINVTNEFSYEFSASSYVTLILLFSFVFLLLFLLNIFQVRKVNPIELLKGGQQGEKEPKAKYLSGIVGIVCIVSGYIISLTIQSPLEAISYFFIAVVLVIVGTYGVFMSSSLVILKLLKRNKKFYYQPNHFISVSSMMYRMKQNAAGLASITILCTMVLVTLSTTASLYFGSEDVLKNRNPYDISIVTKNSEKWQQRLQEVAEKNDVSIDEINDVSFLDQVMVVQKKGKYEALPRQKFSKNAKFLILMSAKEYERLTDENLNLNEDSIATLENYPDNQLVLEDRSFKVQKKLKNPSFMRAIEGIMDTYLVVFASEEIALDWLKTFVPDDIEPETTVFMTMNGMKNDRLKLAQTIKNEVRQSEGNQSFSSIDLDRKESKVFIGGFLFLGLIFGLTFTIATGMIIYYKQISEGYQDKERFEIMQRVGMSHREVRKIIHGQILMVFFFPIALATLHLGFAFPIIRKLLLLFGLGNWKLLLLVNVITVSIFVLIYLLMYWQTSKVYYKLVER